jgi:dihydroorotase
MLLIKNGLVIDPVTHTQGIRHLVIDGKYIKQVTENLPEGIFEQVIDAEGQIVAPGLVDIHVHFRDPGFTYKEDIQTGANAAAKGGFTTVVCMANTKPVIDTVERLQENIAKGNQTGIHVLHTASVTEGLSGEKIVDMEALAKAGAVGFTDDGIPIMDEKLLKEAMERVAALDVPISLHEENPNFIASQGVNAGPVAQAIGVGGASALAEDSMVARDCMLAYHTGAKVDIQHISSATSVKMVRAFKAMGASVYAEATPHHFTLTQDAVLQHGTMARMNPPLRTEADRQEIIKGLADGTIDCIATDHAPHADYEKAKPFKDAPSGIIGLETSLALGVTSLVREGHLTMMQLMEKMSSNPAKLYGLNPQGIVPDAVADLVIFNPEKTFVAGNYESKSSNTPFTGMQLYGVVYCTICDGRIVYQLEEDLCK